MSKVFITFFLFLSFSITNTNAQDYMNDILDKTCACIDNIKDTTDAGRYRMNTGTCLINSSLPYKKEIKKDFQINLDKIDETNSMELGKLVGLKMANHCPKVLYKLTNMFKEGKVKKFTITGIVSKIETELFVIISVTEENGKTTKLYWLSVIESQNDISNNYKALPGKYVKINYVQEELFDPKIEEYRLHNIIKSINYL